MSDARPPDVVNLMQVTADYYRVTMAEIRSDSRERHLIRARKALAWLMHKHYGISCLRVGDMMFRHYSSILNLAKAGIEELSEQERSALIAAVERAEEDS